MNRVIAAMLEKYDCRSLDDHLNALREIIQELVLCGLWRGKFFERAVFYGGTALRILHGLDRFSEDMDFSLTFSDDSFDLTPYCAFVEEELSAWGYASHIEVKEKTQASAVRKRRSVRDG